MTYLDEAWKRINEIQERRRVTKWNLCARGEKRCETIVQRLWGERGILFYLEYWASLRYKGWKEEKRAAAADEAAEGHLTRILISRVGKWTVCRIPAGWSSPLVLLAFLFAACFASHSSKNSSQFSTEKWLRWTPFCFSTPQHVAAAISQHLFFFFLSTTRQSDFPNIADNILKSALEWGTGLNSNEILS